MERLLSIRGLQVWFPVRMGIIAGLLGKGTKHVRAVDGVAFNVARGEVFCLVGESGCGKTTTGKAILRLNEPTGGSILFDLPEQDWNRLQSIRDRLDELKPIIAKMGTEESAKAYADFAALQEVKRRIEELQNPAKARSIDRHLEHLERSIGILEARANGLKTGQDPTVRRILRKTQTRIDVLRTFGPRFTPRRARRLDRLEKELKEAKYRLHRAEVLQSREGKWRRTVRAIERRLTLAKRRIETGDPSGQARTQAFTLELENRRKRLTELELSHVDAELGQSREGLEALRDARRRQTEEIQEEFRRIEKQIADLRARGGPGLETLELRAQRDELSAKYDLVAWGKKRKRRFGGRLRAWREMRMRMRRLRKKAQIIYQDPYESLNPKMSIFDIVAEPLLANKIVATPSEAEAVVSRALEDVGLKPAGEFMLRYPHELSGGQRQRVGIATALVVDPDFIVADEPVSMLDASVRTEILALLLDLKKRRNLTYLFITHDLSLAWILADRVAVMYLGKIVEMGDGPEVIQRPRHPYTKALISVVPSPNPTIEREKIILKGERPNPVDIPTGCRFHPRCPMAVGVCGWNSEEVRHELLRLIEEDRGKYSEAQSVTDVVGDAPFALTLATSDPAAVEKYLWKRIQVVALGRPALGAIRKMQSRAGALALSLHQPVEPPLRVIKGDISVACHLVEPEIAVSEAVAVAK